jgi:endonuclease YncB( thermonuclease family)
VPKVKEIVAGRRGRVRNTAAAGVFLLLLIVTVRAMDRPPPIPESSGEAEVFFVADGDTVRARWEGRKEWFRLLRIDTPEKDEEGYRESRRELVLMVEERIVSIVFEVPGVPERDDYGRLLAYLVIDGRNVNVEMVRAGWSPFWTRYGKGRFAEKFRRAEAEAREAGRGLWGRRENGKAR